MKFINVPFNEKDEAKSLGAKWSRKDQCWYVPENIDESIFSKWNKEKAEDPALKDIGLNHFSNSYYFLVCTKRYCWECEKETRVFGVLMPEGTGIITRKEEPGNISNDEDFYDWLDGDESHEVRPSKFPFYVTYIKEINKETIQKISELAPNISFTSTKIFGKKYYINLCEHCKSKQGDYHLFEEINAPLLPTEPEDYNNLFIEKIEQKIEISGTPLWDEEYSMLNEDFCSILTNHVRKIFGASLKTDAEKPKSLTQKIVHFFRKPTRGH